MDTNTLFTMALGLQAPCEVKSLDFNAADSRLCMSAICGRIAGRGRQRVEELWRVERGGNPVPVELNHDQFRITGYCA
jgi:hypothetical protein